MTTRLYLANKAYSSWSMRPWLLMTHFGLPFEDEVVPLDQPTTRPEILRHSASGKLPALAADGVLVWDSLAIIEYCADTHPDLPIWPRDPQARAVARSAAAEMHSGFVELRKACPTNFRRPVRAIPVSDVVRADVERIEDLWSTLRQAYGQGGAFLFGDFCAADAMYAPVVNRFATYDLPTRPDTRRYMESVQALPAWRSWMEQARAEPWFIDRYEAI